MLNFEWLAGLRNRIPATRKRTTQRLRKAERLEVRCVLSAPHPFDLSTLDGSNGFRLSGIDDSDFCGRSVSNAGDFNGDGFADMLIGAWGGDPNGDTRASESYVVFGKSVGFTGAFDLNTLDGTNGFRLDGIDAGDNSGRCVSDAGDVNGDGFDDLIIGAYGADPNGINSAGESYVVFGGNFTGGAETQVGTSAGETLTATQGAGATDVLVGAQGNDILVSDGGADVLYGGEGDDTLAIVSTAFQRVAGGNGSDALRIDGSGITLDLTVIADNRLTDIEIINITGSNTLTLNVLEVLNLSSTSNTLVVRRDNGDVQYDLWIDNLSSGQSQFVRKSDLTETTWTAETDFPFGRYRIWVRGIDAGGNGAAWSTFQETVVRTPPVAIAPVGGTFDRTPTFAWTAVSGAVRYELFVVSSNTGATTIRQAAITSTTWTPRFNLPDGPYRSWVHGVTAQNLFSLPSLPKEIFVGGRTDVLTPVGNTSDTTPTFTWGAVGGAARYSLWVDRVGVQSGYIRNTAIQQTNFTPTTALPVGTYRVWVRAISTSGELAPWSLVREFQITAAGNRQTLTPSTDQLSGLDDHGHLSGLLVRNLEQGVFAGGLISRRSVLFDMPPVEPPARMSSDARPHGTGTDLRLRVPKSDNEETWWLYGYLRTARLADNLSMPRDAQVTPDELDVALALDPAMLFLDGNRWFS